MHPILPPSDLPHSSSNMTIFNNSAPNNSPGGSETKTTTRASAPPGELLKAHSIFNNSPPNFSPASRSENGQKIAALPFLCRVAGHFGPAQSHFLLFAVAELCPASRAEMWIFELLAISAGYAS